MEVLSLLIIICLLGSILGLLASLMNLAAADYFMDAAHRMHMGRLTPADYRKEHRYRFWTRWMHPFGGGG